jgi:serine/threonine protein kinase
MLKPGTIVSGKYRLRHLVAEGGMAEVYLAESLIPKTMNDELFALKRLLPRLSQNPLIVEMFTYEAVLTSSLHHRNIISCREFIKENGNFYIVMEYVLGKDLFALCSVYKKFSFMERLKFAVAIGIGICEALAYIHSKDDHEHIGIVHGDISPHNIMVTANGEIKLFDFGAAKTGVSGLVFEEELVRGNLRYMSPEQFVSSNIDARSDLFSLSLVLWEIIYGDMVLALRADVVKNGNLWDPLSFIASHQFSHRQIEDFFKKGLALDRELRFANSGEMLDYLKDIAKIFNLDDQAAYLKLSFSQRLFLARKIGGSRHNKALGQSIFYLSIIAVILGLFVWVIVAVCTNIFDAKQMHNVPYWPTSLPSKIITESTHDRILKKPVEEVQKSLKMGTLSLVVKPWAEISIDGKLFGSTPIGAINLPEGQHLVQLRNPDISAVALRVVKIYADKKTELVHTF